MLLVVFHPRLIPQALLAAWASSLLSLIRASLPHSGVASGWGFLDDGVFPPALATPFPASFLLELEDELEVEILLTDELELHGVSQPLLSVGTALGFLVALGLPVLLSDVLFLPELVPFPELLDSSRSPSLLVLNLFPASRLRSCRLLLSCRGGVFPLTTMAVVTFSGSVPLPSASSLSVISGMSARFSLGSFLWLLGRPLLRPRSSDFPSLSESLMSSSRGFLLPFALGPSS